MKQPIPFDLERAKAGDPILCEGKPATLVGHFPTLSPGYRVYALREGSGFLSAFFEDGRMYENQAPSSLTMAPKKRVVWVNMYPEPFSCDGHPTKEEAGYGARALRVACVRVEFEEGEGL